jgi:hypothetical protein
MRLVMIIKSIPDPLGGLIYRKRVSELTIHRRICYRKVENRKMIILFIIERHTLDLCITILFTFP